MAKYILKAKVYPDGLKISTTNPMVMVFSQPDFGIDGKLSIAFKESDLCVEYETERVYSLSSGGAK